MDYKEMARPIFLRQAIGSYTMCLRNAYADGNLIYIELSFEGYVSMNMLTIRQILSDQLGTRYRAKSISIIDIHNGIKLIRVYFHVTQLMKGLSELRLHLDIDLLILKNSTHSMDIAAAHDLSTYTSTIQGENIEQIIGTYTYTFSLPVIQTHRIEVNQEVEAHGIRASLQYIDSMPSIVLVYIRFSQLNHSDIPFWFSVGVQLNYLGSTEPFDHSGSGGFQPMGSVVCHLIGGYSFSIYNTPGDWTFEIREVTVTVDPYTAPYHPAQIVGPWVFHFTVPPPPTQP